MNIKPMSLLTPRGSKLAFVFACVLISGIGAIARIALEQAILFEEIMEADASQPCQQYLSRESRRVHEPDIQAPIPPPTLLWPTNPSVPVLQ